MRATAQYRAALRGQGRRGARGRVIGASRNDGESRVYRELRPMQWVTDIPGPELPPDAWTRLENVQMREGAAERMPGWRSTMDGAPADPYDIFYLAGTPGPYWVALTPTEAAAHNGVAWTDITGTWGTLLPWEATGTVLNAIPCFTAPDIVPKYWARSLGAGMVDLPGWLGAGVYTGVLSSFRAHLFALGGYGAAAEPERLYWSDAAAPGAIPQTWIPALDNQAGDVNLSGGGGELNAGVPMRDSLLVYKATHTWEINYVGGQFVYGARKLFTELGAMNRRTVVSIDGRHVVLSEGDLVMHDGVNVQSLLAGKVRRWLQQQLASDTVAKPRIVYDARNQTIMVWWASRGSQLLDMVLTYSMIDGSVGVRDVAGARGAAFGAMIELDNPPQAWDQLTNAWNDAGSAWDADEQGDRIVMSSTPDGKIQAYMVGLDNAGTPMDCVLERTGLDFGDASARKLVSHARPLLDAPAGTPFTVQLASQATPGAAVSWTAPVAWNQGDPELPVSVTGTHIGFRLTSTGNTHWRCYGADFRYQVGGFA